MIKVALVDDHPLVIGGLTKLINDSGVAIRHSHISKRKRVYADALI